MEEYKYVGTDVLWKRMTPAQREQALRLIAKMESEPRVLVRDEDGAMCGMPESVYKEHLELKKKYSPETTEKEPAVIAGPDVVCPICGGRTRKEIGFRKSTNEHFAYCCCEKQPRKKCDFIVLGAPTGKSCSRCGWPVFKHIAPGSSEVCSRPSCGETDPPAYSLANYPISKLKVECIEAAKPFWETASSVLKDKSKLISADITSLLNPFSHLSIDPNYRLSAYFCYDSGYHAERINTVVAATPAELDIPRANLRSSSWGQHIELPIDTFDPLSAIFCDGTPEGFMEAVLFDDYISSFTHQHPKRPLLGTYLFSDPDIPLENWTVHAHVTDWTPKAYLGERRCTISCYRKFVYPTFPYTEHITLSKYRFCDFGYANKQVGGPKPYGSLISLFHRYAPGRSCCIFGKDSTSIADQEEW